MPEISSIHASIIIYSVQLLLRLSWSWFVWNVVLYFTIYSVSVPRRYPRGRWGDAVGKKIFHHSVESWGILAPFPEIVLLVFQSPLHKLFLIGTDSCSSQFKHVFVSAVPWERVDCMADKCIQSEQDWNTYLVFLVNSKYRKVLIYYFWYLKQNGDRQTFKFLVHAFHISWVWNKLCRSWQVFILSCLISHFDLRQRVFHALPSSAGEWRIRFQYPTDFFGMHVQPQNQKVRSKGGENVAFLCWEPVYMRLQTWITTICSLLQAQVLPDIISIPLHFYHHPCEWKLCSGNEFSRTILNVQ